MGSQAARAWGLLGRLLPLLASPLLVGCFFFYDSRWGEAKASQKRVAAQRTPTELRTEPADKQREAPLSVRDLRLRAFATPHYASALVDGRAELERALADANPTLAHDLGFRLQLVDYQVWPAATSDEDLAALLAALEKADGAADADWAVVLASPREMVATSADQLGMGQLLGRYFAIRAMSDAAEFDVIERGFTELSEEEKRRLYAARKRHKAATVLLHELGHTLGVPHELSSESLMSPRYNIRASAFSAPAARLARWALTLRETTKGSQLHRDAARAALNTLRSAPSDTWIPQATGESVRLFERAAELAPVVSKALPAALRPVLVAKPMPPGTQLVQTPSPPPELSASDRDVFNRSRQEQQAGRFAKARELAGPLFVAYPDLHAVQELRCQLALKMALPMDVEREECAPLKRLSGGGWGTQ